MVQVISIKLLLYVKCRCDNKLGRKSGVVAISANILIRQKALEKKTKVIMLMKYTSVTAA